MQKHQFEKLQTPSGLFSYCHTRVQLGISALLEILQDASWVLEGQYYHSDSTHPHSLTRYSLPVLSMMGVGIWRMFGMCLDDAGILNGILTVSGRCLVSFWKVYEKSKSGLRLGVS